MKLPATYPSRPQKVISRKKLVSAFRRSGLRRIPEGRQYWTLAGRFFNPDGRRAPTLEPDQLIEAGFCTADQYRGVEKDSQVCEQNGVVCPKYQVLEGDFMDVANSEMKKGTFKPAAIHLDTQHRFAQGIELLMSVLDLVSYLDDPRVYVALNLIFKDRRNEFQMKEEEGNDRIENFLECHDLYGSVSKHFQGVAVFSYESLQHTMATYIIRPKK